MPDYKDDISPELLEKITNSFKENISKKQSLKKLKELVEKGNATYQEAHSYAIGVGEAMADAFSSNLSADILPDGKLYYNIAEKIIPPTMNKGFDMVSVVTQRIQQSLNKKAGLNIKAIAPDLNEDRIDRIVGIVSRYDNYDDASRYLSEPVMSNFTQSIVDDSIKRNAEFHKECGMEPYIERRLAGNCCSWCAAVAGKYRYSEAPKDVYRRHKNCKCTTEYYPRKGGVGTNVWTKKTVEEKEKIEERKKISEKLGKTKTKPIENVGKSSKIKIYKSLGASGKNYSVKLPDSKQHTKLVGGQEIHGKTFAGKGTTTEIRERFRLESTYKIPADKWQKVGGKGKVIVDGKQVNAELHWYEADGEIFEMKVKRFLDES